MRLFGVPLQIRASFFVTTVLLGVAGNRPAEEVLVWVAVAFVSVILHELGHAFAGRAFGQAPSIVLHGWGGLTTFAAGERRLSRGGDVLVSLAGPAAGLAVGALAFAVGRAADVEAAGRLARVVYGDLVWINVGWSLVNLLPILPLDGGLVMATLLRPRTHDDRAAHAVSLAVSLGAGVTAVAFGYYFGAFLAAWFAADNGRALVETRRRRGERPLRALLERGAEALQRGASSEAESIAIRVLRAARSASLRAEAAVQLAHAHLAEDRFEEALRALDHCPAEHPPPPHLLAYLLLETGLPERAAIPARRAFAEEPGPVSGGLLLRCLVECGRFDEAAALLRASGEHFGDAEYRTAEAAAFRAGRFAVSAAIGKLLFQRCGDPDSAYNVACALARAGERGDAQTWLLRATEAGFRDAALLESDEDLAALRGTPEFEEVRRRLMADG